MRELPAGTVTFVFTDIEGSTRLLRELGADYADALVQHRRVVREAFGRRGGIEVDTQGDAFFFAFAGAEDAVAAALEAQEGLSDGPVRVRMGLHTGEPLLAEGGYVGMDVHQGARIAAAAHGAQIIASAKARAAAGAEFRDLGMHRLKDFDEPVRLYQVNDGEFPPVRSLNVTNLPSPASPLIGREQEVGDVAGLTSTSRLVTLTGAGGCGKTRLALQVATELVGRFQDGVFWVSLAPLTDPNLVLPTIGETIGAKTELHVHIGRSSMLLLLDNFEQVVEAAAALVELVEHCPKLFVLVTSRAPLRVPGESEYSVDPLSEGEAVELFCQRAALAEPRTAVEAICRRLDCLPLAIELAAARTRALPPEQLLERLDKALPILTSRLRAIPDRQRTLRAAIGWSFQLLSPVEQELFARLSVFVGGFELEAAEAVCAASLDDVESLMEQSLVRRWGDRLGMFETIREFATEQLESGGDADATARRHAHHYAQRLTGLQSSLWDASHDVAAKWFADEQDNVRAALAWSLDTGERELLAHLAASAAEFWIMRGAFGEARRWLEAGFETDTALPADLRARAFASLSTLEHAQADYARARRHAETAVVLERTLDDGKRLSHALNRLGNATKAQGEIEAARLLYAEALAVSRRADDRRGCAVSLVNLGTIELGLGHLGAAEAACREAGGLFESLGNRSGTAASLLLLGEAALGQGRLEDAHEAVASALRIYRTLDRSARIAACLSVFARLAERAGDPRRASTLLAATQTLREQTGAAAVPSERQAEENLSRSLRGALDEQTFGQAFDDGRHLEPAEAVIFALAATERTPWRRATG